MNNLKVFNHDEFGELGVLIIDECEYFPATACAKMLGYVKPNDAVHAHCRATVKYSTPISGKMQEINYISEGDLYRLIMRSKLPAAEKFERWVMDEVLPSIRRQGAYIPDMTEIIVPVVEATVCEVMKQIVPVMQGLLEDDGNPYQPICKTVEHRRRKRTLCAIEKLEPGLRWEIDQMLLSGRYSYLDVTRFLSSKGIKLSQTAVGVYYNKMRFWDM